MILALLLLSSNKFLRLHHNFMQLLLKIQMLSKRLSCKMHLKVVKVKEDKEDKVFKFPICLHHPHQILFKSLQKNSQQSKD